MHLCARVSHRFAAFLSLSCVFQMEEGRKLRLRGVWQSRSAVSVDTKHLCTQLRYLLSKKVASKDIDINLFQEGQTQACVVLQKAKNASFCSTWSQSFIRLVKLSKHYFLASLATFI